LLTHRPFFFPGYIYIYSQKEKLKIKSATIKCFFKDFQHPEFEIKKKEKKKKKNQISINGSQVGSQKYKGCLQKITLIFSL